MSADNIGSDGLPYYLGGTQDWEAGENIWLPPLWLKNSHRLEHKYFFAFYWGAGRASRSPDVEYKPARSERSSCSAAPSRPSLTRRAIPIVHVCSQLPLPWHH